ncbi:hypothetical protein B0H11DRAFT_1313457 [Mycena galericulata]|nr:hypothetical protein B0H11DRAFT_1313457 [Mycena galericulata]
MTRLNSEMDPVLPPELERTIFETCALSSPTSIPTLILVAQRVKTWTEPILYRTICLSHRRMFHFPHMTVDGLLSAIDHKSASFFAQNVRNLFIGDLELGSSPSQESKIQAILTAFTGLTNLFADRLAIGTCTGVAFLRPLGAVTSLQRISIALASLFKGNITNFLDPIFHHLTHLETRSPFYLGTHRPSYLARRAADWAGLALLPCLTHFAFSDGHAREAILTAVLRCPKLECCVLFRPPQVDRAGWIPRGDVRFVAMSAPEDMGVDWLGVATGGDDYWVRAEAIIAARRASGVSLNLDPE